MGRLTWMKPDGTWELHNMDIRKVPSELYGVVCKLKDYEETGLTPEQIDEIDVLYTDKCREVAKLQKELETLSAKIEGQELIEKMAEEIENCYGRETELTRKARNYLVNMETAECQKAFCEPEYLGENTSIGCRVGRCSCGNIVRSYQNFCDECGIKLEWGNVWKWNASNEKGGAE